MTSSLFVLLTIMVACVQEEVDLWKILPHGNRSLWKSLFWNDWYFKAVGMHTHKQLHSCLRLLTEPWPEQTTFGSCELFLVCALISIYRNFHLRWFSSSNPSSGPEHLERVNCKTQLRFIYHLNPHRLLTLPAGSALAALVVRCEKNRLTSIKQQSCCTD